MSDIDPITLSVIQAGLQQVCDEMDLTFSRSAFSPVIAEANDRSDGIYDAETGELIAQGELGLPVFVGTMQFSTMTLIDFIKTGKALPPEEGDVYIVNDPYLGGTHLMDVRFAMPFYYEGKPATGQAGETGRDGPGDLRDHLFQHPHRRSADRRHQGADRGVEGGRAAIDCSA
jgi:N-methylhydantoinase B